MLLLLITLISSFSTMAYSMIISSLISDFTGEEIISQTFTTGSYLFGLGIGSSLWDKIDPTKSLDRLWNLEYLSSIFLPLYPTAFNIFLFLILGIFDYDNNLESKKMFSLIMLFCSTLSFLAGLIGGGQLPLILKSTTKISFEKILAINYLGPLIAGPFLVFFSGKAINYSIIGGFIGLIQFAGMMSLLLKIKRFRKFRLITLIIPLALIIVTNNQYSRIENITTKAIYLKPKITFSEIFKIDQTIKILNNLGKLERYKTQYQIIDLFTFSGNTSRGSEELTYLYLNRKVQFNNLSSDVYHESMLYSALNLNQHEIKNILILGGGDGILLSLAKDEFPKTPITLVELDGKMLEISKHNQFIRKLNKNIFNNIPLNTKIFEKDAIDYLRRIQNKQKFDLVFIDFPFPFGHELSKLYSFEFYSLIKNITHNHSLVTIDMPIFFNGEKLDLETTNILSTLYKAGFKNQIGFGLNATFVIANREEKKLRFNFEKISPKVSLATKINLLELVNTHSIERKYSERRVNSMFWPKRFQ